MASEYDNTEQADRAFVILSQIFGAFAHGAGGVRVDGAVILQARDDYNKVVTDNAARWDRVESAVLESARHMGRLAASKAFQRDSPIINIDDYRVARQSIVSFGLCPFSQQ